VPNVIKCVQHALQGSAVNVAVSSRLFLCAFLFFLPWNNGLGENCSPDQCCHLVEQLIAKKITAQCGTLGKWLETMAMYVCTIQMKKLC